MTAESVSRGIKSPSHCNWGWGLVFQQRAIHLNWHLDQHSQGHTQIYPPNGITILIARFMGPTWGPHGATIVLIWNSHHKCDFRHYIFLSDHFGELAKCLWNNPQALKTWSQIRQREWSHTLGTHTKFQLEILTINVISGIVYFHAIILES